jgi:hypothetical protein
MIEPKRVELHPGTDDWMRGDRYGEIVRIGQRRTGEKFAVVRLDKSGRHRRINLDQLTEL